MESRHQVLRLWSVEQPYHASLVEEINIRVKMKMSSRGGKYHKIRNQTGDVEIRDSS
jgi:hypothetical protein